MTTTSPHSDPPPIGEVLRNQAKQKGDELFLRDKHAELSWQEVDMAVDRFASTLLERGLRKGDHMAIWMTNTSYWVVAFLACVRVGVVLIPLNTRYKGEEVLYILRQSNSKILFMMDTCFGIDYHEMLLRMFSELEHQDGQQVAIAELPELRCIVTWGMRDLPGAMTIDRFLCDDLSPLLTQAEQDVRPTDDALIVYTSGTTGRPKGAVHSHEVLRRVGFVADGLRARAEDVILGHMPFYHVGGLFLQLLLALTRGCSLVLMQKWDPAEAIELIAGKRITQIGGTPTHFYDLINLSEAATKDTSCLRAAWIGGTPDMRAVITASMKVFPTLKILPTYGLTEATVSATMNRWDDPIDVVAANKSPPLGDALLRIADVTTGAELQAGQRGEIWLAGSLVMKRYYNDPAATREAITPEGWLRTGDIGVLDAAGYLTITDRLKQMFKVGGTNAYPAEIEAYLNTMPEIEESVVVGVPDSRLSEVGFAFVRLKAGARATPDDVIAHCHGKIANYKVPRYVRILARFPTTDTGKIERASLKRIATDEIASCETVRA